MHRDMLKFNIACLAAKSLKPRKIIFVQNNLRNQAEIPEMKTGRCKTIGKICLVKGSELPWADPQANNRISFRFL